MQCQSMRSWSATKSLKIRSSKKSIKSKLGEWFLSLKVVLLIILSGKEHSSSKDKVNRVFKQIYNEVTRLTSVHAYVDERVVYSKNDYNNAQQ